MSAADDIADFLSASVGFGTAGTLNGAPGEGVLSTASTVEDAAGVLTQAPVWAVSTAFAQEQGAAPGSTAVVDGTTYTVRQAQLQPPDGAVTNLILARA